MSTYLRLAALPVTIESYELERLEQRVSSRFNRVTTQVRLRGAGHEGVGEDPTYDGQDQDTFQQHLRELPLPGSHDIDGFSSRVAGLELFYRRPAQESYRDYRRWAFESAALDLALRQTGQRLDRVLDRPLAPLRFVVSMGLGEPPDLGRVRRWLDVDETLRFKLDASPSWDARFLDELRALDRVDVVDFKGAYHGTPVDQPPDAGLYARVAAALPQVWLEDPAWNDETARALADHLHRITWDAPIHSVDDIRAMPVRPRTVNVKPSRFGTLRRLFDAYDYCRDEGIAIYGGGQFELGRGREQIQYLAAMFHPDASNDVAPAGYNIASPTDALPRSPIDIIPAEAGFGIADD